MTGCLVLIRNWTGVRPICAVAGMTKFRASMHVDTVFTTSETAPTTPSRRNGGVVVTHDRNTQATESAEENGEM